MSEKPEIKQVSTLGSQGTQIGIQNINVGLTPNDAMQMAMQMFREYYPQLKNEVLEEVQQSVLEKLKNVPPENIVPPNPRIAFPTMQNACITPEKNIRELYEELLANSMNNSVKDGVHPGFVEIIKQLCPDEAKIMHYMKHYGVLPIISVRHENKKGGGIDRILNFSNVGELVQCEYPLKVSEYFDNLSRLGLINNHGELSSLTEKRLYEPLKNHSYIKEQLDEKLLQGSEYNKARIVESFLSITSFGKAFCKACIASTPLVIRQPI